MPKERKEAISRRTFIKGAGLAAAAGSGLIGNGQHEALAEQPCKYSFEIPPPPIPESKISQKLNADVVVVGGGHAGMTAALSAAEAGAKVILLEKQSGINPVGNQIGLMGTSFQIEHKMNITPQVINEAIRELMKWGANRIDQRLLRIWVNRSPEHWEWIKAMGSVDPSITWDPFNWPPPEPWDNSRENYKQYPSVHGCSDIARLFQIMESKAKGLGAEFCYNTTAKQLVKNGDRVTGVIAATKDDKYVQYNAARGIIVSTGDYGYNTEMLEKYVPHEAFRKHAARSTSMGEGHQMAMWIGAVMEPTPHAPMTHSMSFGLLGNTAFLHVNAFGERFQNEDVPGQSWSDQVELQPGMISWQIIDAKWKERLPYMSIGHGSIYSSTQLALSGETLEKEVNGAITADTIEELAGKMGVPAQTLKATVERYNQMAYQGIDTDFAKPAHRLFPIDTPPYHAGKGSAVTYPMLVVMGGLIVNDKLQALDKDFNVIKGLYLAGNTVGRRFAVSYPTACPGISVGMAQVHGRYAGQVAAADKGI